jgi:cysteine desulfurase / selenocysteine lyase
MSLIEDRGPRDRGGRDAGHPQAIDVEHIRADFPILQRRFGGKPLVYLDSANTTQRPRQVIEVERDFYENHNANAHRAVYTLGEEATALYEGARERIAAFLGAPAETIVFNRGTTESINLVAHGWGRRFLREGDEILLTEMEHHSNIVPWQLCANDTGATLRYLPLTDEGLLDLSDLGGLLTGRTKILALTGMSNSLGTLPPLRQLIDAAHGVGAVVLVDGAQLVPHHPVSVVDLDCDFLAFSGHKMLGPTASGGLYAKSELLEAMDPFLGGGEMIREVYHDHSTWNATPYKFEAGTMNVAQEVALAAAIDYLQDVGMDAVRAHEEEITSYAIGRLLDAGARVIGPKDTSIRGGAVSFWFKDVHPHDLATIVNEDGIAVRAGHHCNQLVMRRFGVPATARASFYIYNTTDEVDALIEALDKAEAVFDL